MEMLQRMYRLQTPPILETDNPLLFQPSEGRVTERPVHKRFNLRSRLRCQIIRSRVVFEVKLRPHHQVHHICIDAVRPVVEEDFVVRRVCEGWVARRGVRGPVQALMLDKTQHRAICSLQVVDVFQVSSEIARYTLEQVDSIGSCGNRASASCPQRSMLAGDCALTDDFLDLQPRLPGVVLISCRKDALVLLRLVQEVFWALLRSLARRDIDLPIW
jgi:hypothetical protein